MSKDQCSIHRILSHLFFQYFGDEISAVQKKQSLHSSWNLCRNFYNENVAKMLKIYINCPSLLLSALSPTSNVMKALTIYFFLNVMYNLLSMLLENSLGVCLM